MTKYNVQSAGVLNEADRFERILNWQLFCIEQETMLFGANAEVGWVPGDPMYPHPYYVDRRDEYDDDGEELELEGYYGNCVRPMYQLYDDVPSYFRHGLNSCKDCDVGGDAMDTHCWSCGKAYPPKPKSMNELLEYYGILPRPVVSIRPHFDRFYESAAQAAESMDRFSSQMIVYSTMDVNTWIQAEMRSMLFEETERSLWSRANRYFLQSEPVMLRPIRGYRSNLVIVDEAPPPPDMTTVHVRRDMAESLPDTELFPTVLNLEGSRPRDAPNPHWVVPITIPREMPDRNPIPLPEMEPVEIRVPEDMIVRSYPTSRYITQERRSRR